MAHKAGVLHRAGHWTGDANATVALDYEGRFLRRKRLETDDGLGVLVDLPETISVEHGDAFETSDGVLIEVRAAAEALLKITGDLPRLAWHIGNRHTPCAVANDHLLIRDDYVLKAMLEQLGAEVTQLQAPFRPEGGAYGHGRTMGHSHGPEDAHDHSHGHSHEHGHDHSHAHGSHSHMNGHGHENGSSHSKMNEHRAQNGPAK